MRDSKEPPSPKLLNLFPVNASTSKPANQSSTSALFVRPSSPLSSQPAPPLPPALSPSAALSLPPTLSSSVALPSLPAVGGLQSSSSALNTQDGQIASPTASTHNPSSNFDLDVGSSSSAERSNVEDSQPDLMPGGWASRAQSPERSELCSISENQSSSPSSSTSPNSSRPRSSRADGLGLDTSLVQVVDSDKPESSVKIEASPSAVTGPVHLEESPARKPQDVEEELPSRASSSSAESFDPDRAVYGMKQYTHPFFFTPLLPQPALRQDLQPGLGGWANHWNRLAQQPLATVPTPMDVEQPETGNSGAFTPSSVAPPHMHTSQERGLFLGVVEENAMEGVQKTPVSSRPSLEVVEGNAMEGVQETPASSSLSLGVVEENAMEGIEKTQASSSLSENSSDERAAGILDELARMSITSGLSAQVDGDDSVEERMDIPTSQILPILEDKDADLDVQMAIPADLGGGEHSFSK